MEKEAQPTPAIPSNRADIGSTTRPKGSGMIALPENSSRPTKPRKIPTKRRQGAAAQPP
jgi:hypothetical protein